MSDSEWMRQRWDELSAMSDRELKKAYIASVDMRGVPEPSRTACLKAFPKVKERQQRIYFIVSNEAIVRRRRNK